MREDAIVSEEGIYADLPGYSSRRERRAGTKKKNYARPHLNTTLLMVAYDTHSSLAELDDTFLLQLLNCLDQT